MCNYEPAGEVGLQQLLQQLREEITQPSLSRLIKQRFRHSHSNTYVLKLLIESCLDFILSNI